MRPGSEIPPSAAAMMKDLMGVCICERLWFGKKGGLLEMLGTVSRLYGWCWGADALVASLCVSCLGLCCVEAYATTWPTFSWCGAAQPQPTLRSHFGFLDFFSTTFHFVSRQVKKGFPSVSLRCQYFLSFFSRYGVIS